MSEFNQGDWFRFKPEFEPEHVEMGEKFRVNAVMADHVSYLDPDFTDWQVTETSKIVKVSDPNPRLTAVLNRPSPFAKPEDVQDLFDRADALIRPAGHLEGDWEALHSLQEDLFSLSFAVMLKHKDYREEILRKMLEVAELHIPRW